jgi:L-alanine-DL-glutamate epimerase-like enolase superfamily enzyme
MSETSSGRTNAAPVTAVEVSVFVVPTDAPESDGTLEWDRTTVVVVEVTAGGVRGLGYTYASASTAAVIRESLEPLVRGKDALAVPAIAASMVQGVRNLGRAGIASMAISAVDAALWDAKARLLGLPLVSLLGQVRQSVAGYGSGGFTSYAPERLAEQLGEWAAEGFRFVKMKVGREPDHDPERVRAARRAIGGETGLFVDANGAYDRKQALALAAGAFADHDVRWFEEPVSSDDLLGLRLLRDRSPGGMDIAAGEYGYDPFYFERMLDAQAVDVLQADATRCGGFTGFLAAHAACDARGIPLSAHCAPSLHVHLGCALTRMRHLEYFHDHQRIERLLFDGAPAPHAGRLSPDLTRPGLGLDLKRQDAAAYQV